ncbi:MAG: hypothetical protein WD794_11500 [Mycobacteriales bacterium]
MAKIMKADGRQVSVPDQPLEPAGDRSWVQRAAVLSREHQAAVHPALAPGGAFGALPVLVLAEHLGGVGVQGHDARAAIGLGGSAFGLPAELDDLFADRHGAAFEVHVGPGQSDGLAAAQTAEGHEVEQWVEPVVPGVVEEPARLLGCPHRDLGPLPRGAPGRDALFGPDNGLGSPSALEFHVGGRVERDEPAFGGGVQR